MFHSIAYVKLDSGLYGCILSGSMHTTLDVDVTRLGLQHKVKVTVLATMRATQETYCALQAALRLLHASMLKDEFSPHTFFTQDVMFQDQSSSVLRLGRLTKILQEPPSLALIVSSKVALAAVEVAHRESLLSVYLPVVRQSLERKRKTTSP